MKAAFILSSTRSGSVTVSNSADPSIVAIGAFANTGTSLTRMMEMPSAEAKVHDPTPDAANPTTFEESANLNDKFKNQTQIGPMHFCFIVHGHKGHANDLWYLHQSVRDKAKEHDAFDHVESSEKCEVGAKLAATINDHKHDNKENPPRRNKRDRFSLQQKLKAKLSKASDADTNELANLQSKDSDNDDIMNEFASPSNQASSDACIHDTKEVATAISFIVHNVKCNEGKTDDGVVNGGNRLADEILEVIRYEVEKKRNLLGNTDSADGHVDVTISLIGNSLGGLYTRYAVARLAECAKKSSCKESHGEGDATKQQRDYYLITDGKSTIRLHFNVFCTTASPHLGCADHTYFPIPRVAEKGIAYGLGETGRDLFRLNSLLHEMATTPRFTEPLGR